MKAAPADTGNAARMDVDPPSDVLPFPGRLVDGEFETEYIEM